MTKPKIDPQLIQLASQGVKVVEVIMFFASDREDLSEDYFRLHHMAPNLTRGVKGAQSCAVGDLSLRALGDLEDDEDLLGVYLNHTFSTTPVDSPIPFEQAFDEDS